MSRIAYVNGRYIRHADAAVHIEDRGYQFGDGIYEVITVINGKLYDCDGHMARLTRSLAEISLDNPLTEDVLMLVMTRLVRMNALKHGTIYLQITRGVARRDHKFPANAQSAIVMTVKHMRLAGRQHEAGVKAIIVDDLRWVRRDIKTIQLLPNCLAKQAAAEQGAYEAIMVMPDGSVSEGSSSNVWILTHDNQLVTRPASHDILNGITRQSIEKIAKKRQISVEFRTFDTAEMLAAKEVFVTSATSLATAITQIDEHMIADGKVGEIAHALRADYLASPQ